MWEGRDVEDGQRWQADHSVCTCTSGEVKCQANIKGEDALISHWSTPQTTILSQNRQTLTHRPSACGFSLLEPCL